MNRLLPLIAVLLLTGSAQATFVAFEAESGALGAEWAVSNSASPAYITITSNGGGNNPGSANRVASYTVTFPAAGTYQLYARLRTGAGTFNDDSLFFAGSFGTKSPTTDSDWNLVNGLAGVGFNNNTDVVTGGGTLGSEVWKWINLSQNLGQVGFVVPAGNLTQTFQVGAREDGLDLDRFVFGTANYTFTVANLDNGTDGTPPPPPLATITWTNTQQRIDGFGFSSAWCGTLSAAKNQALYGTIGMSLLRIRIDQNNAWIEEIANSAAAHAYGAKVFGCPWRVPSYMTYNVTNVTPTATNIFTYLSTNQYQNFALWLGLAATNIGLDYVSVKNEPDLYASGDLNMTGEEIRVFCRSNAPTIGRPITMADAVGFTDSVSDPTLNDPLAATNVTIVSGHFYGNGNYVHSNALAKGKRVWMTEHYLDGCVTNFGTCLNLAKEINDSMKNQFSAYVAWWAQDGDLNINLANQSGTILKDGYTMGQFSKFIRPGFYRVGTTNSASGAEISAYKDVASSNFVIVAINRSSAVITQQFNLNGFPVAAITPWITSHTLSLAAQTPITNVGGTFTYSIQPSNIVTFVGTPPPLPPTGLTAVAGKSKVALNWNAVTGAASYNIKRAAVSGGLYNGLTNVTATSFADTNIVVGMEYFYVVSAANLSGESANSTEASVVTVPYATLPPVADAYVRDGGSATTSFGSATILAVKNDGITGSGFNRYTYLKFNVSGLSQAQVATLYLTPHQVDGAAPLAYEVWSNDAWIETGAGAVTWNNQPAGIGVLITNISNYTVSVPVAIDVTGAVRSEATNDAVLTIRISQPSANNTYIGFHSREQATSSLRPMLEYALPPNAAPVLAAISDRTIGAGQVLSITNSATDSDVPAQTFTYSLLSAPTNALLDAGSGVLSWRPLVSHANTINPFTVRVADSGIPSLSATQSFVVTVTNLAKPQIATASGSGNTLVLQVSGAVGPDYQIQASTNLVNWSAVFTTNAPLMPFVWTNSDTSSPMNFFRIQAGPPLP